MTASTETEPLLLAPARRAAVCERCFNLTNGQELCFACTLVEPWLDFMAPISYSVSGSPLHRALWGYKHLAGTAAASHRLQLAVLLAHHLARHERCVAAAAGCESFDLVLPVPSSDADRATAHPLALILERMLPVTRARSVALLHRTETAVHPRSFSRQKYAACERLDGATVLLIDDTWATGANAQSAAAALKLAGAARVAAIVIGRHLNRRWLDHKGRTAELDRARPFAWERCPACTPPRHLGAALTRASNPAVKETETHPGSPPIASRDAHGRVDATSGTRFTTPNPCRPPELRIRPPDGSPG